jgi:transposase
VIEQRAEFVALALQPGANRRELCRRFRISPDTAYRWLGRFAGEGPEGLQDRSRRPHRSPGCTAPAVEAAVLALRAQYPVWGARKLRVLLARQGVQPLPATSTITAILRRHGALDPAQGAGQPRAFQTFEHPYPNALWQMDFKALRAAPLSSPHRPRRPFALRARPAGLCRPAHRHGAHATPR